MKYASGRLYTTILGWPGRLANRWVVQELELPPGSDPKLPPLLDAMRQARATAAIDRGTITPGHTITAMVPAAAALRLLALDTALRAEGIDPRTLTGNAMLEVDLDTDNRPRKIRMMGASLQLDDAVAAPAWFAELASSAKFDALLTDYETEVSVSIPSGKDLIDRETELRDAGLFPELSARRPLPAA